MSTQDKKVIVSLYLLGDALDPSEISRELRVVPTVAHCKGEVRLSSTGREYASKTGLWSLVMDKDHAEVSDVATDLLSALQGCNKPLNALSGVEDAFFDVFVAGLADEDGEGTCAFALQADQLATLAKFELPIHFTVNVGHE